MWTTTLMQSCDTTAKDDTKTLITPDKWKENILRTCPCQWAAAVPLSSHRPHHQCASRSENECRTQKNINDRKLKTGKTQWRYPLLTQIHTQKKTKYLSSNSKKDQKLTSPMLLMARLLSSASTSVTYSLSSLAISRALPGLVIRGSRSTFRCFTCGASL